MAIKVRVLRSVQAGLTGMSGLVALSSGVAACTAEEAPDDGSISDESALTTTNPGTGVLELAWDYATPLGYSFSARNSTDEYVRAGEKMTFSIPLHFLWSRLYPDAATPDDLARLKKLSAKVKVLYSRPGSALASSKVATNGTFSGTQTYDVAALTGAFTVNKKAQGLRFEIVVSDAADATKKATVAATDLPEIPVFGGTLPSKTALFDTSGSTFRQRMIEGGKPVAGASLAIGYTDWRVATLVDSSSIDRTIGTATSFGRFGAFTMPIYGELVHEVTYAAAVDGAWSAEQALTANAKSRLMPPNGRVAYEGSLAIPASGQKLEIYFHVRTFLVVDYTKLTNVISRKYQQGERILVREKWDNENAAAGDNYDFTTEKK
ncbi:MAG TPA: hypothetical protein VLT33_30980 [Labilithrix sp.]|nr:hypothetical protein [Labilithrix sp.]